MFKLKFRSDSTRQQRVTDTGRGVNRDSWVGLGFEASSDHSIVCRVHWSSVTIELQRPTCAKLRCRGWLGSVPIKPLHLFWMLLEHWTKNEGITHEHGEFRKSSLAGPISGLMSYDGRVLRLAYEVGKTDGTTEAWLASCSAKEKLGCHAGYDGWRTRCHFCDL